MIYSDDLALIISIAEKVVDKKLQDNNRKLSTRVGSNIPGIDIPQLPGDNIDNLPTTPPPQTGNNLLMNTSFEYDTARHWTLVGSGTVANFSRSTTQKQSGTYSLKIQFIADGKCSISQKTSPVIFPTSRYNEWASLYVETGAVNFQMEVDWEYSSSVIGTAKSTKYTPSMSFGWEQKQFEFQAPHPVNVANAKFVFEGSAGTVIYLDSVGFFGSGGLNPGQIDLDTKPAAATGFAVTTGTNATYNFYSSYLECTWSDDTGADIIMDYEVIYAHNPPGTTSWKWQTGYRGKDKPIRFEVLPNAPYLVNIRQRNTFGNYGPWLGGSFTDPSSGATSITSAKDNTAPAIPTNVSVGSELGVIRVSWDAVADADLQEYIVVIRAGAAPTKSTYDKIFKTRSTIVIWDTPTMATTYHAGVYAIDTSGNESALSATASALVIGIAPADFDNGYLNADILNIQAAGGLVVADNTGITAKNGKLIFYSHDGDEAVYPWIKLNVDGLVSRQSNTQYAVLGKSGSFYGLYVANGAIRLSTGTPDGTTASTNAVEFNSNGLFAKDGSGNYLSVQPSAIQSSNYVSNTSGYKLQSDGTIYCNNLIARGSITVTSSSSGYGNFSDKPTSLSGINSTEGTKLGGVETGATNVAAWRHPTDTTKIDGGDIYTGSVRAAALYSETLSLSNNPWSTDGSTAQSGSRLFADSTGIYGYYDGSLKFKIGTNGSAIFTGDITGASGTFGGTLSTTANCTVGYDNTVGSSGSES